jgi:hypothetical protein
MTGFAVWMVRPRAGSLSVLDFFLMAAVPSVVYSGGSWWDPLTFFLCLLLLPFAAVVGVLAQRAVEHELGPLDRLP